MALTFGTMLPGDIIRFSVDMAGKIPPDATLESAAIAIVKGASAVTITSQINGSKVVLRIEALQTGQVVFNVTGVFSDGSKDGEQVRLTVE